MYLVNVVKAFRRTSNQSFTHYFLIWKVQCWSSLSWVLTGVKFLVSTGWHLPRTEINQDAQKLAKTSREDELSKRKKHINISSNTILVYQILYEIENRSLDKWLKVWFIIQAVMVWTPSPPSFYKEPPDLIITSYPKKNTPWNMLCMEFVDWFYEVLYYCIRKL